MVEQGLEAMKKRENLLSATHEWELWKAITTNALKGLFI